MNMKILQKNLINFDHFYVTYSGPQDRLQVFN
jgi:hypothetical protein